MAFSTVKAFAQGLGNLSVSGVNLALDEPPRQIAILPCSYPRLPTTANREVVTFDGGVGLTTTTVELVVIIESMSQSTNATLYAASLDLYDALNTALTAAIDTLGIDRWSIEQAEDGIGGVPYWALVARVEASG